MKRRVLLNRLGAAWAAMACAPVMAQDFPVRALRIVVPYAAGGSPDIVTRITAQQLSTILGQPVVIDNLSGSSGIAAIETVKNAAPDGYTLLVADAGHWAVNRLTRKKLPYDAQKDLQPIGVLSTSSLFLTVHELFPATNLQELVAAVKAKPGVYTYGSSGIGSLHNLTMEAFKAGLGLDILHVPYKGTGQSVPALAGGQVSMAVAAYNSVAGFSKVGKVRILAANTRERSRILPQYPPMGDAGLKDFDFPGEIALFAPAGTPKAVVERLSAAVNKAISMPDTVARFAAAGVEPPLKSSPAALAEIIQRDMPKYAQAVKVSGIQPE